MTTTLTRRSFALAALASAGCLACAPLTARAKEAVASSSADAASDVPAPASVTELGHVSVYDCGDVRLHAFCTGDALGDECFVVEGADALVAIELPAFEANLAAYKSYVDGLGKPVAGLFVDAHPTGASWMEGVPTYATAAAKAAIESGSTNATTMGLAETFGPTFRADDLAVVTDVVEEGPAEVGGIQFEVAGAEADTYDLVIPAASFSFAHRCMRACLADTLEHVKGAPCEGVLAFQADFLAGALSKSSQGYWTSTKSSGDLRAYARTLATCVPRELFDALDAPEHPQPTFEVTAAALARAAREMDEGFYLSV